MNHPGYVKVDTHTLFEAYDHVRNAKSVFEHTHGIPHEMIRDLQAAHNLLTHIGAHHTHHGPRHIDASKEDLTHCRSLLSKVRSQINHLHETRRVRLNSHSQANAVMEVKAAYDIINRYLD